MKITESLSKQTERRQVGTCKEATEKIMHNKITSPSLSPSVGTIYNLPCYKQP